MSSRVRLPNEPPLLDPERAIRLAEEASAFFDSPGDGRHELSRLAVKTAMDAAHVAIETAIDTGDPRVLAAALPLATKRAIGWGDESFEVEIGFAADPIFPALTEIDNRVRGCARSTSAFLRVHTARGLGPRAQRSLRGERPEGEAEVDAEAAGIVIALTKDKDAAVRAAAREALGGAAPPAWATFFPRDPLAAMPAAEAARLRAPLDRAAEALEKGLRKDAKPLADAIAELPDELAAPILDAWIRTGRAAHAANSDPLIERWLALDPDGERTVAWLGQMRGDHLDLESGARVGAVLKAQPTEHARAICLRVATFLDEGRRKSPYAAMNAERLLEAAWPNGSDPTPLLELALGAPLAEAAALPEGEGDESTTFFRIALAPGAAIEPVLERLVDAFLAGTKGRWARVEHDLRERLVTLSHPRLRAHAETVLREGEGAPLSWALRHLTEGGHDPSVDPPVERFLEDAARDPRLRAALVQSVSLRGAASDVLRAQLGAGELPPEEAITVAEALFARSDEGSLRPEEWAALRRARLLVDEPSSKAGAVRVLPAFERWTEEDREFVSALVDEHGDDMTVAICICVALRRDLRAGPPRPELVPLLERLLARSDGAEVVLQTLKSCRGEDPYS